MGCLVLKVLTVKNPLSHRLTLSPLTRPSRRRHCLGLFTPSPAQRVLEPVLYAPALHPWQYEGPVEHPGQGKGVVDLAQLGLQGRQVEGDLEAGSVNTKGDSEGIDTWALVGLGEMGLGYLSGWDGIAVESHSQPPICHRGNMAPRPRPYYPSYAWVPHHGGSKGCQTPHHVLCVGRDVTPPVITSGGLRRGGMSGFRSRSRSRL